MSQALNRSTAKLGTPAPVKIVHLGLGAFHRAHQAWYTAHAADADRWGIAAFTGRTPTAAVALEAQEGIFTLVQRGPDGDAFEHVGSIVQAYDGGNQEALSTLVAASETAVVTLTITEPAYYLGADGKLDLGRSEIVKDLATLKAHLGKAASAAGETASYLSTAGRLVDALAARRASGTGPLAVVSCDNLANNAAAAHAAIQGLAAHVDSGLAKWIQENVSFVGTSVDRITPRTTTEDLALVERQTGFADACAVVTEPFTSWILSGDFPAGRPHWESAGAIFVDQIEDFENRKLWLLNGAHSIMAYAGSLRGHDTVAQALADPVCAAWVQDFWDEAQLHLTADGLDIPAYRSSLLERFANARISHHLAQIAMDGSSKLPMRAIPIIAAEQAQGRSGAGAARMIAAWILFVRHAFARGVPLSDARSELLVDALEQSERRDVRALLAVLDPLATEETVAVVEEQLDVVAAAIPTTDHLQRS